MFNAKHFLSLHCRNNCTLVFQKQNRKLDYFIVGSTHKDKALFSFHSSYILFSPSLLASWSLPPAMQAKEAIKRRKERRVKAKISGEKKNSALLSWEAPRKMLFYTDNVDKVSSCKDTVGNQTYIVSTIEPIRQKTASNYVHSK